MRKWEKQMKNNYLSREDTKILKGLAIVLMLMHHLWAFPDRIAGGSLKYNLTILGKSSLVFFGSFGKICVALFMFLGGYGLYISLKGKKANIISKIYGLYCSYWKVFVIFIPIGFAFCRNQPNYCENVYLCTRYDNFLFIDCLKNIFGLSSCYNEEWWFLLSYVFAIIAFPVVRAVVDKNTTKWNILIVIILNIMVLNILPSIGKMEELGILNNNFLYKKIICQSNYFVSFWMGVVVAKEKLLERISDEISNCSLLNPIGDIALILTIVLFRQALIGDSYDMIYVPFFVVAATDLINRIRFIRNLFEKIGKQSTNMWLIHTFCCYYFYPLVKIVVAPKWGLLSLFVLIIMSYVLSVLVSMFWNAVGKFC